MRSTPTFGGVAPAMRVRPASVLRLWSDDAFGGVLRSVHDLSSAKVDLRFVNPRPARSTSRRRTGRHARAHTRGAGAGPRLGCISRHTLLRRHDEHRPGRDPQGRCRTPPGSMSSTETATPLPSRRGTATTASSCRSSRCSAPSAWRQPVAGALLAGARTLGGNMDTPPDAGGLDRLPGRERRRRALLHQGTATTARARRSLWHRRRGGDDHHLDRRGSSRATHPSGRGSRTTRTG